MTFKVPQLLTLVLFIPVMAFGAQTCPMATSSTPGCVKPDGSTTCIKADGTPYRCPASEGGLGTSSTGRSTTGPAGAPTTEPMLSASSLSYVGAFRLPSGNYGCSDGTKCSFNYAGRGIAFNAANNSLFIFGHVYNGWLAEVNIPTPVMSSRLSALPTASMRQNFANVWQGTLGHLAAGGAYIDTGGMSGGVLVNGSKLVISQYADYDAGLVAMLSHATVNANWSSSVGFSGMKTVGSANAAGVGQTAGYMTPIPSEWQGLMGGQAMTGQALISIITRSAMGPAAWVFNPDDVGVTNPVPATQVVGYPDGHWTLGDYSAANSTIGGSDLVTAIVWPTGSRTVMFFGRHGDTYCYGTDTECGDPANGYKGAHGYPYHAHIWAYDANDLLAVKSGAKKPWQVVPAWGANIEGAMRGLIGPSAIVLGAAYDPTTKRIYVMVDHGDGPVPVVHVFSVTGT